MRDSDPELDRWLPLSVAELLPMAAGSGARWWLSGGVALDLFLGRTTRDHADLDVSVARADWPVLAAALAPHLQLCAVDRGRIDDSGAHRSAVGVHSFWARRHAAAPWCLQLNLEPVDGEEWIYRRDARVRLPLGRATWQAPGLRCVDPAVQLLWKSAAPRERDELDWRTVVPRLPDDRAAWLRTSIRLAHPTSPWAGR